MPDVKATTLVTIQQAREWVLNDAADASKDALLVLLADAASARLERETARVYRSRVVTGERSIGDGCASVLYLNRFPIISISAFTLDDVTVDSTHYYTDGPRGRIVFKNGYVLTDGGEVVVSYTAGYANNDLPDDAVELCLHLVKRAYQLKTKGGQSFESVNLGGHSFMMRDSLPADLKKAIAELKDKRFG